MKQLLRSNLKYHWRRYLATGLAVLIAVIFVVAVFAVKDGLNASLSKGLTGQYSGASAVVQVDSGAEEVPGVAEVTSLIESVPQVGAVAPIMQGYADLGGTPGPLSSLKGDPFSGPTLVSGELPAAADELILERRVAEGLGVQAGDTLAVTGYSGYSPEAQSFFVSGIYGEPESSLINFSQDSAIVTAAGLEAIVGGAENTWVSQYLVAAADGVDPDALVASLREAVGDNPQLVAEPVQEVIDAELKDLHLSTAQLSLVLMAFPAIAIVVAIIVVSNTFKVLIQQRKRELGLLRCVGASAAQVRRLLLAESFLLGAIASALGVILGVILSAFGIAAIGLVPSFTEALSSLSVVPLLLVFVAGVLITVLAGIRPAGRIAKAPPLVTFTASQAETTGRGGGWWARLIIGALIAGAAGTGRRWAANQEGTASLGLAVLLGPVTLIGLTVFLSAALPVIVGWVGSLWRGNLGRLVKGNALRNPGRTAATGVSVVIGVSLIVMMMVGAASASRTLNAELDQRMGTDLEITSTGGDFTEANVLQVADLSGVAEASGERGLVDGGTAGDNPAVIYDVSAAQSVNRTDGSELQDGQVLVSAADGFEEGAPLSVCVTDTCIDLKAVFSTSMEATPGRVGLTAADFDSLVQPGQAELVAILAQLENTSDYAGVSAELSTLQPDWQLAGTAAIRAQFDQIIGVMLTAMVALLAVSVLIALVGVSNTLALSVAERTRELGLLRALGMTRGQVSRLLTAEALLIALTASALGIAAGIFFGWAGSKAVLGDVGTMHFAVPWGQLAGVLGVALVAAALASWLPGRRAGRVSPVEALAST